MHLNFCKLTNKSHKKNLTLKYTYQESRILSHLRDFTAHLRAYVAVNANLAWEECKNNTVKSEGAVKAGFLLGAF